MRFVLIFILLSGCGYRWQPEFPSGERPTVAVPYIGGDMDGSLTAEVVRTITSSGLAEVRHGKADFRLHAVIIGEENQTVGYRRDRQKVTGEIKKNIVSCEGRKSITVEVTLYKRESDEIAYGPYRIASDADFDYVDGDSIQDLSFINKDGTPTTVLPFSLGQLESFESAQEASRRPLNEKLAQKIVDAIFSEW